MKTTEDFIGIPRWHTPEQTIANTKATPSTKNQTWPRVNCIAETHVNFQKPRQIDLQSFVDKPKQRQQTWRRMTLTKDEVKTFIKEAVAKSQVRRVSMAMENLIWTPSHSIKIPLFSFWKIVVFSKSFCPFCMKTKELLKKSEFKNVSIEFYELDKMQANQPTGAALQFTLREMTGHRTVPNIWVNGEFVGGNDTTQALYRSGELQKRLKTVSAQACFAWKQ